MPILNQKYALEKWGFSEAQFNLPEKVLQFGTGVLLRGLVDYLIDKANKQNTFNGRVVVVKSTGSDASDFGAQDNVFTIQEKGVVNGQIIENQIVNTAISRVLTTPTHWQMVLDCASNPDMQIVISNVTEVGLQYVAEDIFAMPPASFPAKLTAFLFERFTQKQSGMTVIPTELIVDNGKILRGMVLQHSEANKLPAEFVQWVKTACDFCSSLVDRIVPGSSKEGLSYTDNLAIQCEPFLLWAVEGNARVRQRLGFAKTDNRLIIADDITPFREQKLRILNGGHTISVALAYLLGVRSVRDMMTHPQAKTFVKRVILEEILPTLAGIAPQAETFAADTLSRFENPFIEHKLLSITWQSSSKMQARNVLTFDRYYQKFGHLPRLMCLGFAAYLRFLKPVKMENNAYFGENTCLPDRQAEGVEYPIVDDKAAFLKEHWDNFEGENFENLVQNMLSDTRLFEPTLKNLPHFTETISRYLKAFFENGVESVLEKILNHN